MPSLFGLFRPRTTAQTRTRAKAVVSPAHGAADLLRAIADAIELTPRAIGQVEASILDPIRLAPLGPAGIGAINQLTRRLKTIALLAAPDPLTAGDVADRLDIELTLGAPLMAVAGLGPTARLARIERILGTARLENPYALPHHVAAARDHLLLLTVAPGTLRSFEVEAVDGLLRRLLTVAWLLRPELFPLPALQPSGDAGGARGPGAQSVEARMRPVTRTIASSLSGRS